jgi:hypothetical protein
MYPYFDNADGVSAANPDYDPREAGKNTIEMLDDLNPDLILLGNCQGAGIDKSQLFPENKKAVTIVVSNERLVGPELKLYTDRNFERFCVRTELIRSFPSFLLEVKVLRDPKLEL